MAGEVVRRQEGAARGTRRNNVIRDRPLVKIPRSAFRNGDERSSERRQFDDVAFRRREALEQEVPGRASIAAQLLGLRSPVPRDARRNWKAALGVANCRGERERERTAPRRSNARRPRLYRPRHTPRRHRRRPTPAHPPPTPRPPPPPRPP